MVTKLQPTSRSFVVLAVVCLAANLSAQERKVARVGMLLPLSGGYASVGEDNRRGIEMALAEGGEAQVVPVYGDSGADPIQSIREFRNLLL
jgi:ABC-type branched-subunit amino acid transport system substrate-binding protein